MEHKERRRFIRHLLVSPLEFQIEKETDDKGKEQKAERSETIDVSEGGLLFMSKQEVAENMIITLNMPLYDKVFKIKAKVVHVNKESATGLYRVGVSFISYVDAFKVKLIEQIYLIEEYRVLRSLQLGKEMTLQDASKEWIKRYSERFQKLYW